MSIRKQRAQTDRHTHMSVAGRAAQCIRKACITHSVQSPLPDSWLCKYRFICSSFLILFLLFSRPPRSLFSYPREEVAFLVFIRIIRNKETIGRDLRRDAATVCNNNNNNTIPTGGPVKERKCLEIVNIRTHRRALYNVCLPHPPRKPPLKGQRILFGTLGGGPDLCLFFAHFLCIRMGVEDDTSTSARRVFSQNIGRVM